jgi:hypothetical protein
MACREIEVRSEKRTSRAPRYRKINFVRLTAR